MILNKMEASFTCLASNPTLSSLQDNCFTIRTRPDMAERLYTDSFGVAMKYTYQFSRSCPLYSTDIYRLCDHFSLTLSSSSEPDYPGDFVYESLGLPNPTTMFFDITEDGCCRINVGHYKRRIERISDLPGNDRVLRYVDNQQLGSFEKTVIKTFTLFLRDRPVYIKGPFKCLQDVRPEVTPENKICTIVADRPVPLHVPYFPDNWRVDPMGTIAPARHHDANALYHFRQHGIGARPQIPFRYIYGGATVCSSTLVPERMDPRDRKLDPEELSRQAFLIKGLANEWLKLINVVSSQIPVSDIKSHLERICDLWEDVAGGEGSNGSDDVGHAAEMRRIFDVIGRNEVRYKIREVKAGLEIYVALEAEVMVYSGPDQKRNVRIEAGNLESLDMAVLYMESAAFIGPIFDMEVWISYSHGLTTAKRIYYAAKRAQTLPETSRLLGLDNVYELRPYLPCMNYGSYVAGACFLYRKNAEPGAKPDSAAWHFKVKDLVGYIYSSKLCRRLRSLPPAVPIIEDGTVYYEPNPNVNSAEDNSRLSLEHLELYVGGKGYEPKATIT